MRGPFTLGILFSVIGLLMSPSAHAQSSCQDVFLFSPIHYNILKDDQIITDAEVSDMTSALTTAANLVKSELTLPSQLTVRVQKKHYDPKARGTLIIAPYQFADKALRHHSHAVLIHEFGHTLFDANTEAISNKLNKALSDLFHNKVREKIPNYDEISDNIARLEKNLVDGRRAQNLHRQNHEGRPNGDLAEIITMIEDDLRHERAKIPKVLPDFNLSAFRLGYEELFADVVAVATVQRPSAIASAITPLTLNRKEHARSRDFLAQPPPQWESSEVHEIFWPARHSLSQHSQAVRLF